MRPILLSIAAVAMVIVVLKLTPVPVAGQAPSPSASYGVPADPPLRTVWGEPDLQGLWVHDSETPLQRPAAFADREFFTEEEIAEIDVARARRLDHDYRAEVGTPNDVSGAYNAVYHLRKPTGRRTSLIIDPPDGRMPATLPAVAERQAISREFRLALLQASPACRDQEGSCSGGQYGPVSPRYDDVAPFYGSVVNRSNGPEDHGMATRCLAGYLPAGGEGTTFSSGQNGFTRRIVQTAGGITMYYDTGQGQGWQRSIVMNGSPHLPPHVRQWWGDSRGHWEGDTLVIDVTNFNAKTSIFGGNVNMHLVERFTRTGPETLEYIATMEDPTRWGRPWTVMVEYNKQSNEANRFYIEPRCHEGNYGLAGILAGSRTEDRAYAAGTGPHPATICSSGCSEKEGAPEYETTNPFGGRGY